MTAVGVGIWMAGTAALVITALVSLWRNRRDRAILDGRRTLQAKALGPSGGHAGNVADPVRWSADGLPAIA